eukprot:11175511-Lingulodinium_polyedra.AAC.1
MLAVARLWASARMRRPPSPGCGWRERALPDQPLGLALPVLLSRVLPGLYLIKADFGCSKTVELHAQLPR